MDTNVRMKNYVVGLNAMTSMLHQNLMVSVRVLVVAIPQPGRKNEDEEGRSAVRVTEKVNLG
jgi:hypothetical protein